MRHSERLGHGGALLFVGAALVCLSAACADTSGEPSPDNGGQVENGGEDNGSEEGENGSGEEEEDDQENGETSSSKVPPRCGTPEQGGPVGWIGHMTPSESHPPAFDAPAPPLELSAQVWAEGMTEEPGPAAGLVAEIWTNVTSECEGVTMEYSGREGNNHIFSSALELQDEKGVFRYRVRAGEPGGWRYGPESLLLSSPLEGLSDVLEDNPPGSGEQSRAQRGSALGDLDSILLSHYFTGAGGFLDVDEPGGRVHRYVQGRAHAILDLLQEPFPDYGVEAEVFFIYNMGVVVRTGEATVGVDVTLPSNENQYDMGWDPDPAFDASMAAALDMLLVTHHHTDHADESLMTAMIGSEKPVLATPHLAADVPGVEAMPPEATSRTHAGVQVEAFAGPHVYDHVLDRVTDHRHYQVTFPCGLVVVHTGDLDHTQGVELSEGDVDILFIKAAGVCPRYDPHQPDNIGDHCDALLQALDAIKPNLALPSHLMELGHPIGGGRYGYSVALDCAQRAASSLPGVDLEVLAPGDRLVFPLPTR